MRIDIGASVRIREGDEIGRVERVIVNPRTKEVDALVVHRGVILTRDVIVPLSLVQDADKDGVRLRIGRQELDNLPDFIEMHYAPRPSRETMTLPYAPGSMLFPLVPPYGVSGVPAPYEYVEEERETPAQDVDISEGTEVRTVDGPIGVVDEVRTDPLEDRVSTIVVKMGPGLRKKVDVPVEFVSEVAADHLKLSLTTHQVEELPQPVTDRYLTVEKPKKKRSRR